MSNIIRTSGKVALPVLIVIGLIAALVGVQYFARSAPRPGSNPAGDIDDDGDTYLPPLKLPMHRRNLMVLPFCGILLPIILRQFLDGNQNKINCSLPNSICVISRLNRFE